MDIEKIKDARKRRKRAKSILESCHLPNQPDIECECCFTEHPSTEITQCADGHLFCLECAKKSAQNIIGLRKTELKCISTESCRFEFTLAETARFLPQKEFIAYELLLQEKEIAKANLEGFVQCPFCPFGMISNIQGVSTFKCLNKEICGVESCLKCKKKAHRNQLCEAESSATNMVAEAMTEALMRECPSCHTRFFKTEGCNKMTCTCGQKMCYCCRKPIEGYDHFRQGPGSCQLHDDTNARNKNDAVKAGEAKMAELGLSGSTAEILLEGSTFNVDSISTDVHPPLVVGRIMNDFRNQVRQAEAQFNQYHNRFIENQRQITGNDHELMPINQILFQALGRLRNRLKNDIPRLLDRITMVFPEHNPAAAIERARIRVLLRRYDEFLRQKNAFEGPLLAQRKLQLAQKSKLLLKERKAKSEERLKKSIARVNAVKADFERAEALAKQTGNSKIRKNEGILNSSNFIGTVAGPSTHAVPARSKRNNTRAGPFYGVETPTQSRNEGQVIVISDTPTPVKKPVVVIDLTRQ